MMLIEVLRGLRTLPRSIVPWRVLVGRLMKGLRWSWQSARRLWLLWLVAAGLAVVGLILWAAVIEPPWLLPDTQGLSPADRVKAQTDLRNTLLSMLGGLALLVGGGVAAANVLLTQRIQCRAQVIDLFTRAIEQLGQVGAEKLDVRIGAVYALEQIARDSAELHWPIMEVFTSYLREHAPARPSVADRVWSSVIADTSMEAPADVPTKRTPADHQAIATVIGRRSRSRDPDAQRLDLRETNLSGVRWTEAHVEGASLGGAHLEGADLCGAHLEGADLCGAHLERARLSGAHLEGADLAKAHLERANLVRAHLERATLIAAHPEEANLWEAHLEGATLWGAHLEGADLSWAHLEGAGLSEAYLERADLREAHLERANLVAANLEGARLWGAHLEGARLDRARLAGADLYRVRGLTWEQLQAAANPDRAILPAELAERLAHSTDVPPSAPNQPGPEAPLGQSAPGDQ